MARKGKGRQKVNMVKMENESHLQVTFSKRRYGIFKKASELCILCGAQVAVIIFSPGHKVYSFGHPCVETVVDMFLTKNPPPNNEKNQYIVAHRNATVCDLNVYLAHVENQVQFEMKRGEILDQMMMSNTSQRWWKRPIDNLNLQQLENLKVIMENLKEKINKTTHELILEAAIPSPSPGDPMSSFVFNGDAAFNYRATRFNGASPVDSRENGTSGGALFHDREMRLTIPMIPPWI